MFTSEDDLHNHANQGQAIGSKGLWLGDVKYRDLDGNNVINDGDMTYIGDPNPNFTFGLTNSFKYKGFDLSVFLQGSQGNDILNYTKRSLETPVNVYWNQLQTSLTDRYSELFNTNGTVPRYNQWHQDNKRVSSRFVEDGSYLRIQNITLGYNLPAAWINRIKMQAARIYISGQNIYTFTKYSGYDPELGSYNNDALMQNIDLGNYPNPRTFTIGANITF
ncbi:TonB dependent receptor [compost metagenome]